mmetsp:Transcript_30972/g.87742  ORF Transcript_30972/g.87742 Transcript_30972/m.87742 type:complete len:266 (+) Transcript_30972:287-1084(+)
MPERRSSLEGATGLDPDAVCAEQPEHIDPLDLLRSEEEEEEAHEEGEQPDGGSVAADEAATQPRAKRKRGQPAGSENKGTKDKQPNERAPKKKKKGAPYTYEEKATLIALWGSKDFQARFKNRTEKQDSVWEDQATTFNKKGGGVDPREKKFLRDRFENLQRRARLHNLKLARANGTAGGSGNGREVIEDLEQNQPLFFNELVPAGALDGPLGRGVGTLGVGFSQRFLSGHRRPQQGQWISKETWSCPRLQRSLEGRCSRTPRSR